MPTVPVQRKSPVVIAVFDDDEDSEVVKSQAALFSVPPSRKPKKPRSSSKKKHHHHHHHPPNPSPNPNPGLSVFVASAAVFVALFLIYVWYAFSTPHIPTESYPPPFTSPPPPPPVASPPPPPIASPPPPPIASPPPPLVISPPAPHIPVETAVDTSVNIAVELAVATTTATILSISKTKTLTEEAPSPAPSQKKLIYMLAVTWPPTFLLQIDPEHKQLHATRKRGYFSVHGLWFEDSRAGERLICPYGAPYQPQVNNGIKKLAQYWSNIKNKSENHRFWKSEWVKHGRCMGMSQKAYFRAGVALLKLRTEGSSILDMGGFLRGNTGNSIAFSVFDTNVYRVHGVHPNMVCISNTTHTLVLELRFCVNDALNGFVKCKNRNTITCTAPGHIVLPSIES